MTEWLNKAINLEDQLIENAVCCLLLISWDPFISQIIKPIHNKIWALSPLTHTLSHELTFITHVLLSFTHRVNPKTRTFHPNSLKTHLHLKDHTGQKSQKMSHSKLIFEEKIHVFTLKMVLKSFRWSRNYPQKNLTMKTFQMVLKTV